MDEALAYLSPITSQVQGMIDVVGSHPHFALIAVFLLALARSQATAFRSGSGCGIARRSCAASRSIAIRS
jgi:hypothetical protein